MIHRTNKKTLITITVAIAIAASLAFFAGNEKHSNRMIPLRTYRVAIFAASDIPAIQRLIKGTKDFLSSTGISIEYQTFYFNMNFSLLRGQLKEAISKNFDVFYTIGRGASQSAYKAVCNARSDIPVVFSSVYSPVDAGLAITPRKGKQNISGTAVTLSSNHIKLDLLLKLRPDMREAIIVYSPLDANLEACQMELKQELKERRIKVRTLTIDQKDNVKEKLKGIFDSHTDAVFILRDYFTIRSMPALLRVCESYGATLFSHDHYSVEQGAAAAFCHDDYVSGLIGGEIVFKFLSEQGQPDIVYLDVSSMEKLMVNPLHLRKQNVTVPLSDISCIKGVEFCGIANR